MIPERWQEFCDYAREDCPLYEDDNIHKMAEELGAVEAKVAEQAEENGKLRELILELEPDADINELLEVE